MTPAQELVGEVLAARWRLGEPAWTFRTIHNRAITGLEQRGLVWKKAGVVQHTILAGLTERGREAFLSESWKVER